MAVPDLSNMPLQEALSFRGRVVVVTGGGRGIGIAIARRFAELGADVAVADLDERVAKEAATELRGTGARTLGLEADVGDEASVHRAVERIHSELGPIDVWVNNAGVYPRSPVLELDAGEWDDVLRVNLRGTFLGAREAARHMVAVGTKGVIVNVSSTTAFRASGPGLAHYVSSKHGVAGLTKQLAVELGRHGIRVVGVAPALTDTPTVRSAQAGSNADFVENLNRLAERIPLGRMAVPDDVARVAVFCASDLAVFVTGSTIPVDGGDLAM